VFRFGHMAYLHTKPGMIYIGPGRGRSSSLTKRDL